MSASESQHDRQSAVQAAIGVALAGRLDVGEGLGLAGQERTSRSYAGVGRMPTFPEHDPPNFERRLILM
jgi:hypothetical protein